MDPKKAWLIVLAALVASSLVAGGVFLTRSDKKVPASTASPSPSAAASARPSPSASASATKRSIATPTASSGSASGSIITADGAILSKVNGTPVGGSIDMPCSSLADTGWTYGCGIVSMKGGRAAWVAQSKEIQGSATRSWIGRVFVYVTAAGAWVPRLEAADLQGDVWAGIKAKTVDVTKDGFSEIVFGYRFLGSGNSLGVDVVTWQGGNDPVVAAHPDTLSHGSASIGGGQVDLYDAQYPNGEANCCPAYFRHQSIRWDGSRFRSVRLANVNSVPATDL